MMDHNSAHALPSTQLDARVRRTRDALRNALIELFESRDFDAITIREICARAGAGYATFFRHYPDKRALLDDLAADEIRALLAHALPIVFAADTRAACVMLCRHVDERRPLWTALLTGGVAGTVREEFVRQARLIAADSPDPGGWLPTELRVVFGVSGVIEIVAWWLRDAADFPVPRVAEILDRLVIAPIVPA